MPCSQCLGIEKEFGEREARAQQRRYRERGAAATTRELVSVLVAMDVAGKTVLDIGGGVGAIQHGLLEAGASRVRSVDASSAYVRISAEEARRLGLADRVETTHGDFVSLADSIPPADIVTLDRVLCCYHDVRALVAASAGRAKAHYGLVYPRDAWWLRPVFALGNLWLRLRRSPFRIFMHPTQEVEAAIRAQGLRRVFHRFHGVWQVAVFTA